MKKILTTLLIILLLACCKTQKIAKETVVHDTIYKNSIEKVLDSVFVDRYNVIRESGDTIFVYDSVAVLRWRDRIIIDTFIQKNDSIIYENTIEEKSVIPTYYKVMHWIAWILLALLLIIISAKILKLYIRK